MTRCTHAHQIQRLVLYQMGHHLEDTGKWACGLCLMQYPDCDGSRDPRCGKFETG